ncbi:hypothetical protein [Parasediminibacterium sp. JCM 36343]|uniref:hypothetical protein n=1 Tax=Parasediminibacterium sp. JCM 36343 TaxID=3374279 RepID=UPI00397C4B64
MEPQVAAFLKRILTTIGIVLFWMGINSTTGIMFGYGYIEGPVKAGNIIFYIWLVISLPLMVLWLRKLWKDQIDFDEDNR